MKNSGQGSIMGCIAIDDDDDEGNNNNHNTNNKNKPVHE
jgi:hypothetical protein